MPKCAVPKPSHPKAPPSPPPPPPPPAPAMDLKTLIHDHSLFFDRLVDLIPARFYVPAPDADERPWFHGLSNSAKASAKKQSRENIKKARRARYDPERTASTLDLLKNTIAADKKSTAAAEHEGNPNSSDAGSDREAEVEDPRPAAAAAAASVTYEELRRRLHRRIEELRGNRNTRALDGLRGKRRRDGEDGKKKKEKEEEEEFGDVAYGKVRVGGVEERGRKRKKLSMRQELGKAEKLEDAKKDAEKGKMVAEKHSWRAAMSRAVGEKVHDDPKVLRQSLRKERKRHQKHAEKWKERIEGQNKVREEKQKSRSENIRERIQQKKARRIEKREKKLMRPGFEGRKDGYINE